MVMVLHEIVKIFSLVENTIGYMVIFIEIIFDISLGQKMTSKSVKPSKSEFAVRCI